MHADDDANRRSELVTTTVAFSFIAVPVLAICALAWWSSRLCNEMTCGPGERHAATIFFDCNCIHPAESSR